MNKFAQLKPVDVHGIASCIGAQNVRCYSAPLVLQGLDLSSKLKAEGWDAHWSKTILLEDAQPENADVEQAKYVAIHDICQQLSINVQQSVSHHRPFIILGGDHSCAIGTWSGAASALHDKGDIGLVWIDAHMDSHTPETSHSGAIHGMPVASLLGYGDPNLVNIAYAGQKIKPENICLIGVRSYEPEEKQLLDQLGVKVFYADECEQQGLEKVFAEALTRICKNTCGFGISLDLDAIDPLEAPGVGSPAANGLNATELMNILSKQKYDEHFLGFEMVELNSSQDKDDKTAKLAVDLIQSIFKRDFE